MPPPPPGNFGGGPPPAPGFGGPPGGASRKQSSGNTIFGMPGVEEDDLVSGGSGAPFPGFDAPAQPHDRMVDLDPTGPSLELGSMGDATGHGEVDLPAPVGSGPEFDLDLPAPVRRGGDAGHGDLELDLPTPVGPPRGAASAADLDFDLPTPVGPTSSHHLDLPAPVSDLDLPAPVSDLDLPTPVEDLDLPTPVDDLDLPTPFDDLLEPASDLPTPVENLPAPRGDVPAVSDLELDLDFEHGAPTPGAAKAKSQPNLVDAHDPSKISPRPDTKVPEPTAPMTSPAPRASALANLPVSKPVLYGAIGIVAVALIGGGLWASGLLGGGSPDVPPQRGVQPDQVPQVPAGEVAERAPPIMKEMAADTPAGYQRAMAIAEQAGDKVGQAEAALLLHLRYGPDEVLFGQARGLLEPYAANTEPFVTRVQALLSLAVGDAAGAKAKLGDDGGRTALYRSWAELQLGEGDAALRSAQAAAKALPEDKAAKLAVFAAKRQAEGPAAIDEMIAAEGEHAEHPAYTTQLVRALVASGRYAEASTRADAMSPLSSASEAHQASILALRAEIAAAQGQRAQAQRLLESAHKKAPNDVPITVQYVDVLLASGDVRGARRESEVLVQANPDNVEANFAAARTDLAIGEGDSALARADKLAGGLPNDPRVPHLRGQVFALRAKIEQAQAAFAAARELSPLFADATVDEVHLLTRYERVDDALALLDAQTEATKAVEGSEAKRKIALARLHHARAEIYLEQGKREEALGALDQAIANDPTDNAARLLRGETLLATGEVDAGQEALIELFERTGGFPGLTGPLGRVFLRRKQYERLESLIGSQLDDPDKAADDVLIAGARLRVAQEKHDAAIKLADQVLQRSPTNWESRLVKGQALLGKGEYETALIEIEQAKPREPDAEVEMWIGQALEYNGRAKEAAGHYKQAMELDPSLLEASALYGRQLAYAGAAKAALDVLDPLLEKSDDFPYAYTAQGLARRDLGKSDAAVSSFRKATELDPDNFEAYYWEGRLHNDRNKHSQAARALSKAVESGKAGMTYFDDAHRRLGEAYESLGRGADAKKAYQKYLEIAAADAPGRAAVERRLSRL